MKNICQIFITDFKRIKTNVVAVVIMLGLIILPSLYAWFNILSNWDPYGEASTSKIKVAVASDDEGVDIEGTYFNMGDKVISALEANTTIGWVFTDTTQEAIDGVYSGDYYAALIMPDDFTSDLVSFLSDDVQHPEIIYYENEKKNAIAPKITAKAKTAVQQQVNATFVSTLAEVLTTAADTLMDTSGLQAMGVTNADSLVDVLIDKLNSAITELNTYEALVDSFLVVTDSVTATAETAQNSTTADDAISSGQSAISQAQGALNTGLASYLSISKSLAASLSSVRSLLNSVSESYTQMQDDMAAFNDSLVVMGVNLHQTRDLITDMKDNLQESVNTLTDLKEGDRVFDIYLCKHKQSAVTKNGKPYETVILQDKTGTVDGKIWDPNSAGIDDFDSLDYIEVYGDVTCFQGANQINIKRIRLCREGEYEPANYLPVSKKDISVMYQELLSYINSMENEWLKKLMEAFFVKDEAFLTNFKKSSAAKSVHHGFVGGLLEHTLGVVKLCDYFAKSYPMLKRDLLLAAAMCHDIGKTKEISLFPRMMDSCLAIS